MHTSVQLALPDRAEHSACGAASCVHTREVSGGDRSACDERSWRPTGPGRPEGARKASGHLLGKGYVIAVRVRVIQILAATDNRHSVSEPPPSDTARSYTTQAAADHRRAGGLTRLQCRDSTPASTYTTCCSLILNKWPR